MAKVIKSKRNKGKGKGKAKAAKSPKANRHYWTKQEFASYLILRGMGMSDGKAEGIAQGGTRYAYGESNKALTVTKSARAEFDKAYAKACGE